MVSKVNPYISNYDHIQPSEYDLNDQLVIETIQNWGQTFHYIPRVMLEEDKLWGEDKDSQFEQAKEIEMLVETVDTFDGEGDALTMFGVEMHDTLNIVVSKTRWKEEFGTDRPKEGDLLYYPMTKSLFQINYADDEDQPFFQLGRNYIFRLKVERYEYGFENMNTGIEEVDNLNNDFQMDNLNDIINIEPTIQNDEDVIKEKVEELNYWDESGKFLE